MNPDNIQDSQANNKSDYYKKWYAENKQSVISHKKEKIKTRNSYNLSGLSFNPSEIAASIRKKFPDFEIEYTPDFRQKIADSWPQSIDDSDAQKDWGWKLKFDLAKMTEDMLKNLKIKLNA